MNIALLALLSLAQTESAPSFEWKPGGSLSFVEGAEDTRPAYRELTLGVRVIFLGGDLDTANSTKWTDLWGTGYGFDAKYSHLFKVSPVVAVGPYAGFTIDGFPGKDASVQSTGTVLDADTLIMTRLIFGARVREQWGAFWMDQNIGIGPAVYSATTASQNVFFNEIEIIKTTTVVAFEMGFRAGVVVSRIMDLGLGLTWEYNGAPDVGSDIPPGTHYHAQSNVGLTFLLNLNF